MKNNFDNFWRFLKYWEKEYSEAGGHIAIYGIDISINNDFSYLLEMYKKDKEKVEEECKRITKKFYWDALSCDNLTEKLDIVIADTAFLQGVSIAKQVLKYTGLNFHSYLKYKKFKEDFIWLVALLNRIDFLDNIKSFDKFGRGWSKRIISLYDYLLTDYKELKWD